MSGLALSLHEPPPLDGSLDAFDFSAPLELDHEDQYRRSEEPYAGPEEFSATAAVGWDHGVVYVAVDVRKPELVVRGADAAPLARSTTSPTTSTPTASRSISGRPTISRCSASSSFLRVTTARIRVSRASGAAGDPKAVQGAWQETETGYSVAVAIALPEWEPPPGARSASTCW